MILRILRKFFQADTLGLFMAALALEIFAYGVTSSLRSTESGYFYIVCIIAAAISWGLGKGKLKPIQASAVIVALGVTGIWILGARLINPITDLIQSIASTLPFIIPAIQSKTALDASAVTRAWQVIVDASITLMMRFQAWLAGFNRNVPVNDSLVRDMVWLLLHWLVAAWAGWFTARRKAIAALLPAAAVLALVTSYSGRRVEAVWVLVFFMLLLMGIWSYSDHIMQWEVHKVDYSESIRYDITQAALFLTITVCSIAIITPSVSWRDIRDRLREYQDSTSRSGSTNETANILGIQEKPAAPKPIDIFTVEPILPRSYLLSGGFAHSQKIVMTIRTGEMPPAANAGGISAPRYYWRNVIYDQYMGSGWLTSSTPPQHFLPDTPLLPGLLNSYKLVYMDVQLKEPQHNLFWSGILFSANVPLTVDWRFRPEDGLFIDQSTLLQADMFDALTEAASYKVDSYVPKVSVTELRTAPVKYPQNIIDHYLQLPSSVPARVLDLAKSITRGKTNPYDKAKAIEGYLRANYPYDLTVPAPPPGHDVADFFLFDLKRGYCDYYATSMVVMARAVGIPARFVSGYSPGTYDPANAEYIIREANAHSWVEVYFAGIGWVEYEPTSAIPEINSANAEDAAASSPSPETNSTAAQTLNRFRLQKAAYFLLPIFILFVITVFYLTVFEKWRYLRMSPVQAIKQIHRKFYRAGRPLAGVQTHAETSLEFIQKLTLKLNELDQQSRFKNGFGTIKSSAAKLTDLYNAALFIDAVTKETDAQAAWTAWTQLRWRLFFARIILYQADRFAKTKRA